MKTCRSKVYRVVGIMMWGVSALIVLAAVIPVFCFDQFRIKGVSMNPTLLDGDHVLVNKLLFGARIYKDFDFSKHEISSFRCRESEMCRLGMYLFSTILIHIGLGR